MKKIQILLTALLVVGVGQAFCANSGSDKNDHSSPIGQPKTYEELTLAVVRMQIKGADKILSELPKERRSHITNILDPKKRWADLSNEEQALAAHLSTQPGWAQCALEEAAKQKEAQKLGTGLGFGLVGSAQFAGGLYAYSLSRDSRKVYNFCRAHPHEVTQEFTRQALRSSRMGRALGVLGMGLGALTSSASIKAKVTKN